MYTYVYIVMCTHCMMAVHKHVSINTEQEKFLTDRGLSASKILQDGINSLVKEIDPDLYQAKIDEFTKDNTNHHQTKWQKLNDHYAAEPKKRAFGILLFGQACGQEVYSQVEKLEISTNDMVEVIEKLKEFKDEK